MKRNIGNLDRLIRVILGIVILVLGIRYKSWWGILGIPVLITGIIGWCGLYTLLKGKCCCCGGKK